MKYFIGTYYALIKQNLSVRNLLMVFFFELIGSVFSVVAIFLLGLVINLLTQGEVDTHLFAVYVGVTPPLRLIVLSVIALNVVLLCASAASYFYSVKLCRKYARGAYISSLDRNVASFADSSVEDLKLGRKELDSFRGFFTTDLHLTFMSVEAMLRAIRPISLIVVFVVPLLILEPRVFYFLVALVFIAAPFLFKINRDTASSAKSVFGAERKKVYAEITSAVKKLDNEIESSRSADFRAYDEAKMTRMLDNFDYWKLSSDKVTYVMTIVKSVGLQLVIVILVGALYYYEGISVSIVAVLGMGLLKIQEAFLGFFSRLTVLSRLYPVVQRYMNLQGRLSVAALGVNENKERSSYSKNSLLFSGKLILMMAPSKFRKSEVAILNEQLSLYGSEYDIRSLVLGDCFEIVLESPIEGGRVVELLHGYALNEGHSDVFMSLKKQMGDVDISKAWEEISVKSKLFLYLLFCRSNDDVQYVQCSIDQIELVKLIVDEAFTSYDKPVVVFCGQVDELKKACFDIVLESPEVARGAVGADVDAVL